MLDTILKASISYLVPIIIGIIISKFTGFKLIKIALMTLIQSTLTNTYFVYEMGEEIPDYVYRNWVNLLKVYEKLGGDDYIHTLYDKMKEWKITRTGIIKEEIM